MKEEIISIICWSNLFSLEWFWMEIIKFSRLSHYKGVICRLVRITEISKTKQNARFCSRLQNPVCFRAINCNVERISREGLRLHSICDVD